MSNFRTVVKVPEVNQRINYETNSLFVGSCFSENIGNKLTSLKFPTEINPFGVLYNPISIANSIELLIKKEIFTLDDLQFHNNLWFSFSHHSSFSHPNKETCLTNINKAIADSHEFLLNTKFLFISYGTSRVYINRKTNKVVSNCHKLPSSEFEQILLEPEELFLHSEKMIKSLIEFNPDIQIIFTISPIRHWKDGAYGNQLNKSTLFLLIKRIKDKFRNVNYFPSYEIMMDELRDYRFYSEDMIHLNNTAINYIFDQFSDVYIEKSTNELSKQILKISSAVKHKPFNPGSPSYKKFAIENLKIIESIMSKLPKLNFSDEINFFENIAD